jgi:aromatic ring-opening dioxygenase catalytic subunit (LigB family)
MTQSNLRTQPSLFIPHGGGPCFFMDWTMGPPDTWDAMAAWLRGLAATLPQRPRAAVVISAHWEEAAFAVTSGANPPLIYDYYGFPEHTYHLAYPAPGMPELAGKIVELLSGAGLPARADAQRGFDHGVFVPFKLIFPEADIPIVQLSLHNSLDPRLHLEAGRALAALRRDNVLIVGSGMSYHNMRGFGRPQARPDSDSFDAWLSDALLQDDVKDRDRALINWEAAPLARAVHPREEHLIPLMVAAGTSGADGGVRGEKIFTGHPMNATVSAFRF